MENPLDGHWKAVKRILRHFKGTIDQGIILYTSQSLNINAYADADWRSDHVYRKSTSRYCIYLGKILYHGVPRNKIMCLDQAQKLIL